MSGADEGPGLTRLEGQLDAGEAGKGGLLFDRPLQPPPDPVARILASARFLGEVKRGGTGAVLWDEVRWEGTPGGQSIWMIKPASRRPQEIVRLALRGSGPLRSYEPAGITAEGVRSVALRVPLATLLTEQGRREFWTGYVGPALDVSSGLGAVVGVNEDRRNPDIAYLLVSHDPVPTTYKAVLVWRPSPEATVEPPAKKGKRPPREPTPPPRERSQPTR